MSFTDNLLHTSNLFLLLIELESYSEEDRKVESSCGVYAAYSIFDNGLKDKAENAVVEPSCIKIFNCQQFKSWEEGVVYAEMNGYAVKEDITEEMNTENSYGFSLSECIRPLTARRTVLRANIIEKTRYSYADD